MKCPNCDYIIILDIDVWDNPLEIKVYANGVEVKGETEEIEQIEKQKTFCEEYGSSELEQQFELARVPRRHPTLDYLDLSDTCILDDMEQANLAMLMYIDLCRLVNEDEMYKSSQSRV